MFIHFGMNTFSNREWGEGTEEEKLFNPAHLDCRQWAKTARDAGFKYLILTCKHHDGFCLWPSRFTEHSVKNSPWKDGRGDVVAELASACREFGVKMGVYLSPWDRNQHCYGDSPAYNEYFRNQLTELLSNYGDIAEVWFDGACGEGPNGKRQEYDWNSYYAVVRRLQPNALIAICGPDIRWVGNEDGFAHETEWSVVDGRWHPAECDVSIRPGWFYHPDQDAQVKSLDHLLDIYYRSVGLNSVLLLNVPPNRDGLIADPDVARLREFRAELDRIFATDFLKGAAAVADSEAAGHPAAAAVDGDPGTWWCPAGDARTGTLELILAQPATFDLVLLQEEIAEGQRVQGYRVEALVDGTWRDIGQATTIGHKKLDRIDPVTASRVRVTITASRGVPLLSRVGLFARAR
ncbi:MAG: alpha-L-fucosidase [Armatimonadetes bacterium]|nr:alpha-L-fucosidase [Armatimonadota bacterium]